jgi:hypothetical protein
MVEQDPDDPGTFRSVARDASCLHPVQASDVERQEWEELDQQMQALKPNKEVMLSEKAHQLFVK